MVHTTTGDALFVDSCGANSDTPYNICSCVWQHLPSTNMVGPSILLLILSPEYCSTPVVQCCMDVSFDMVECISIRRLYNGNGRFSYLNT